MKASLLRKKCFFLLKASPKKVREQSKSNQEAVRESIEIRVIQSEPKILRLVTILTIRALCRVARDEIIWFNSRIDCH